MRYILILILWVSTIDAQEISRNFHVNIIDNKKIKITTYSMNYYIARLISSDGTKGSPKLIDRNINRVVINSDKFKVEWNGILPYFVYNSEANLFNFASKDITIDSIDLISDWENSSLKITGGNLNSIFSGETTFDEVGAFLLNLTAIPKMVADFTYSGKISFTKKLQEDLEFMNKLTNLKDKANSINSMVTYFDISIKMIKKIYETSASLGIVNNNEVLTDTLNYLEYTTKLTKQVLGSVNLLNITPTETNIFDELISVKMKNKFKMEEKYGEFKFGLAMDSEKSGSKYFDAILKDIHKNYKIKDEQEKALFKVGNILLSSLGDTLTQFQTNKLKSLTPNTDEYKEMAMNLAKARLAIGVAVFSTSLFANDIKDSKTYAGKFLLEVASDAFKVLGSHLVSVSETLAKNSIDPVTNKVSAGASQLAKGVQIGNTVANQLIPFLYEFGFGEPQVIVDISNGQINRFGRLEDKIVVKNEEGITIWDSSNQQDKSKAILYAKEGDLLAVSVYAKQLYLFDDDRSPWSLYNLIPRKTFLNIHIHHDDQDTFSRFCVVKPRFRDISFSQKILVGDDAYNISNQLCYKNEAFADDNIKYSLADFDRYANRRYKLKSFDEPVFTARVIIKDYNKPLSIISTGYGSEQQIINNIELDIDDGSQAQHHNSYMVENEIYDYHDIYDASNISLASGDKAIKYVWHFPDGTEESTDPIIIHSYDPGRVHIEDNYHIVLEIHTEHGAILYREMDFKREDSDADGFSDEEERLAGTDPISASSYPDRIPLIANAGVDQEIIFGDSVILDASKSISLDGIYSYLWIENNDLGLDAGEEVVGTEEQVTLPNLPLGDHNITLIITDNNGVVSFDSVLVSVKMTMTTPYALKKTGQTKSYDEDGHEVTDGTLKDDGYYQKGVTSNYSRDDNKEIVSDNITGLMWQDDEEVGTVKKQWFTDDNYKDCVNNSNNCENTSGDTSATYCNTLELGGYNDWRLPTIDELVSITEKGMYNPAIDPIFSYFRGVFGNSSSYVGYNSNLFTWTISTIHGDDAAYHESKSDARYVKCVRDVE